jgi:hypothetical protein
MVLLDHDALTPAGKPTGVPMPVAPVVVCVMFDMAAPKQGVGDEDAALTVFGVGQAGRNATITAAIVRPPSFGGQFTLPLPVDPVVGRIAQAAPTADPF